MIMLIKLHLGRIGEAESFRKASTVIAQSVQTLKKILKNS